MRLAVLADIHGNLPAFEAALEHVQKQGVDQIVIAGDLVIGSPDSRGCWELARSLGCPILRGNHERYLATYGTPAAPPEWSTERFAPVRWSVDQIPEPDRTVLGRLPQYLRIPDAPDIYLTHASERDDHDSVGPHTPEEVLHKMFPTVQERYIIRGHNHEAQTRVLERGYIITSGSVGLPLDSHPTAQYLIMEQNGRGWRIMHQSVPYNLERTIQRFHDTNYLAQTGPMGRLFFRELVTASHQIVPFLRLYSQWTKQEDLSLAQAVDRFLAF